MTTPGGLNICPHCGFDLEQDAPVEFGRLSYDPRVGVMLDGKRLKMSPQSHLIIGSLMREPGRAISRPVLAERIGYAGDDYQIVDVISCRARQQLRREGLGDVIENIRGVGLRFVPDARRPAHSPVSA